MDGAGFTELMVAAHSNSEDCVLYFLHDQAGLKSYDNLVALDYAVMADSLNVFPALFEEELGAHTSIL